MVYMIEKKYVNQDINIELNSYIDEKTKCLVQG